MSSPIVVLGASYAGIPVTHRLLKTLPASESVILVSPSTHMYWSYGAARGAVNSKYASSMHSDVVSHLSSYPAGRIRFLQGLAIDVDPARKILRVRKLSDEDPTGQKLGLEEITYQHLIIATGSRDAAGGVWKTSSPLTTTRANVDALRAKIEASQKLVVSGAGATGLEVAGEIATIFPQKTVIQISAGDRPLDMAREDVGNTAASLLKKLGVDLRCSVKVLREELNKDTGRLTLVLSDGSRIEDVDLHIPTHGLIANTSFLPKEMLDSTGALVVDRNLRAKGYSDIWGIGDVLAGTCRKATLIDEQFHALTANVLAAVTTSPTELKGERLNLKEYLYDSNGFYPALLCVPVGSKIGYGTGILWGWWRMWGWTVWAFKGRNFLIGRMNGIVTGQFTPLGSKV